jgi:hypothetical protein
MASTPHDIANHLMLKRLQHPHRLLLHVAARVDKSFNIHIAFCCMLLLALTKVSTSTSPFAAFGGTLRRVSRCGFLKNEKNKTAWETGLGATDVTTAVTRVPWQHYY